MTNILIVTLTETSKTPGGHAGRLFAKFAIEVYVPKRALR